jgi:hypothetical protein
MKIIALLLSLAVSALRADDSVSLSFPGSSSLEVETLKIEQQFDTTYEDFITATRNGDFSRIYEFASPCLKSRLIKEEFSSNFPKNWKALSFEPLKSEFISQAGAKKKLVSVVIFEILTPHSSVKEYCYMVWEYEKERWNFINIPFSRTSFPPRVRHPKCLLGN